MHATPIPHPKQDKNRYWYATAIVLLCDDRQCRACGRIFRVPNTELMVKLESPVLATEHSRLVKRSKFEGDTRDLPYLMRVQRTITERCHECFAGEPEGQLLLFPRVPPKRVTWADILAQKREEAAAASNSTGTSKAKAAKASRAAAARSRAATLFGDL